MKKKIKIRINPLVLIGVFLMLTNSCKKDDNNPNIIADIDGNVYHTVTIGTQVWMVENLKTTKYRNGDPIPLVTDGTAWSNLSDGAYCNYNNDANNSTTYSRLYNWFTITDSRQIAPAGWHIPSDAEWATLTTNWGGEPAAGVKLKETGTTHWQSPNTGATNESGFTALPGGYRSYNATFHSMASNGFWWSKIEGSGSSAWSRDMGFDYENVGRSSVDKNNGYSVRCVKD